MSKKPDITTITTGYFSTTMLNNNFENIRDQFDNTLSLDGSTPNAMQADLDFNNNSALNVDSLEAQTLTVGGSEIDLQEIKQNADDAEAAAAEAALYEGPWLDDVAALLADTSLTYTAGQPGTVTAGDIIRTRVEGFAYEVAASGAGDAHVTTAGGVGLYVLPGENGFDVRAFGTVWDSDSGAAVLAALTGAAGQTIDCGGATIRVDSDISYAGKVDLRNVTFDHSNGGSIDLNGGIAAIPGIAADIAAGDRKITFVSAHGLSSGDVFCVWNPTSGSFYSLETEAHDGCWFRVAAVNSTTEVEVYTQSPAAFAAADVECYVMGGEGVRLENVTAIPAPGGGSVAPIHVGLHQNVDVINPRVSPSDTPGTPTIARGIRLYRCFDFRVDGARSEITEGTNSYPLGISNCQQGTVTRAHNYSDWHALSTGGAADPGCCPVRDIQYLGCISTVTGAVGAVNTHIQAANILHRNGIANGAMTVFGQDVEVSGYLIRGRDALDNYAVRCDPRGGVIRLRNLSIETVGNSSSWGLLHFSNLDAMEAETWIEIDEVTINHKGAAANLQRLIMLGMGAGLPHALHIRIGTLRYMGPTPFAVVAVTGDNPMSSLSGLFDLEIENYDGPGVPYLVGGTGPRDAGLYDAPMRLPAQMVREDFSLTTSDDAKLGSFQSYTCAYPRTPDVSGLTIYRTDESPYNPGNTGEVPIPYIYDLEKNEARMGIKSTNGGTFTAAQDVRVAVTAQIKDW